MNLRLPLAALVTLPVALVAPASLRAQAKADARAAAAKAKQKK